MSCPVCLSTFTDPVVLPCGHSLCNGICSQNLIRDHKITCPQCRSTHWIPEGEHLPKNYDLTNMMHQSSQPPGCETHPGEVLVMFCTDCYVSVCVKCFVTFSTLATETSGTTEALHKDHNVIHLDKLNSYVQDLVCITTNYLHHKQKEETDYLREIMETNETVQDVVNGKCELVKMMTEKLKKYLDERSERQINALRTSSTVAVPDDVPGISEVAHQTLSKLKMYEDMLKQCDSLTSGKHLSPNDAVDIKRVLSSLNEISDCPVRPDPRCYLQTCFTLKPFGDVRQAVHAIRSCYNTPENKVPDKPMIVLEDCVANQDSVSVTWKYSPGDKVNYFIVYYGTAIFTKGMCSDESSTIVSDFGRLKGHITLRDLSADVRYKIYVTAYNELGESPRSEILYVKPSNAEPELMLI